MRLGDGPRDRSLKSICLTLHKSTHCPKCPDRRQLRERAVCRLLSVFHQYPRGSGGILAGDGRISVRCFRCQGLLACGPPCFTVCLFFFPLSLALTLDPPLRKPPRPELDDIPDRDKPGRKEKSRKKNRKGKKRKKDKSRRKKDRKDSREKDKEAETLLGVSAALPEYLLQDPAHVVPIPTPLTAVSQLKVTAQTTKAPQAAEARASAITLLLEPSDIPEMPTHEPDSTPDVILTVPTALPAVEVDGKELALPLPSKCIIFSNTS